MYIGQEGKNQIELSIKGYEHPDVSDNYFEANWLNTEISVKTVTQSWNASAPVVLSNELSSFNDWLLALQENKAQNRFFDFEDPSLYVCMTDKNEEALTLEFHLHLDFRCPDEENHETRVAVAISKEQLDNWTAQLQAYTESYPTRYVVEMF